MKIHKLLITAFILSAIVSCKYEYVDDKNFIGTWELKGRSIYADMQIQFKKDNNELKGYITKIPQNKYSEFFPQVGEVWFTSVSRASNYAFIISEKKIASELLSTYELETISTFHAIFSDEFDKIYLVEKSPNPSTKSSIYLQRIN